MSETGDDSIFAVGGGEFFVGGGIGGGREGDTNIISAAQLHGGNGG